MWRDTNEGPIPFHNPEPKLLEDFLNTAPDRSDSDEESSSEDEESSSPDEDSSNSDSDSSDSESSSEATRRRRRVEAAD